MKGINSQVCTSIEQSKRLLAMGLKPETADMIHLFDDRDDYQVYHRWVCRPWKWSEEDLVDSDNIPAWSLHRLMIIGNIGKSGFTNVDEAYNTCISLIASHIRFGLLNKEYFKQ